LLRLEATVHAAKLKVVVGVALILVGAIKLELSKPGTGKLRRRGKIVKGKVGRSGKSARRSDISKLDRASAPGEPPAVDTGVLRNSINFEIQEFGKVVVGTANEYAEPLEFGTHAILPRPFMRPALANVKDVMGAAMLGGLKAVTRNSP
jgi:phage gpG-like protein